MDIRNQFEEELNDNENFWSGKYKAFTPWSIIWGCYRVNLEENSRDIFSVTYAEQPECQTKCTSTNFFTVKGNICKCLHPTEVDEQRKEKIKPCTCSTCFTVLRHSIDNVGTRSNTGCSPKNTDCTCMAAACINNKLMLTPETCDKEYKGVCDNNNSIFSGQADATQNCYTQGSNLRWYSQDQDRCDLDQLQHWTSGRRSIYQYIVKYNDEVSKLNPLRCLRVAHNDTEGMEYVNCSKVFPFFCQAGRSIHEVTTSESQSNDRINTAGSSIYEVTTSESQSTNSINIAEMIVGIVVSVVVIILMTAVIIVFMYRRIHSGQLLSLNTIIKDEPSTSIMDSYTVNAAYEQLHKTDKDKSTHCQSYDQLHSVHVAETINKTNPRISREEESKYESIEETNEKYYNTVTAHAEYEQLDQAEIEKTTNLYDPLHFTNVGNSDTTNDRSNIFVLKTENRKYEPSETKNEMDTSAFPLKYEQLDITKIDTSTSAYAQLHFTNDEDNNSTKDNPKVIVLGEEHTYYETSKYKKECDTSTVSSKYEDLDITETDKSVKTYEQLHLKHVEVTEPTVENSNNMISGEIHAQCKPLGDNVNKDTNTDYSYYEQLDSAVTNESTNAYDQLHAVHVVDITKTNDHNTNISTEEICKN